MRITGTVTEFFGETQLSSLTSVEILSSDNQSLVTTAALDFPTIGLTTNVDGESIADLEAFEGMLVNVVDELTVGDLFTLGRFGEVGLSAQGRLATFTQVNAPDVAGFEAYRDEAVSNTLILDDGSTIQNPDVIAPLDANPFLSSGDTINDLTGVIRFSRGSGGSGDEKLSPQPDRDAGLHRRQSATDRRAGCRRIAAGRRVQRP